ncbi:MAG: NAD(P)H-binding protein [Betaproteobacteria bacterium]|nr:NAD(P)H-binding protein [Betaproteobacteria bacterium]
MFVLMGANGNITSKTAHILLKQGHKVRVIGRKAESLAALKAAGAELAIGDAGNADFLAQSFKGATAIYTMIPPNHTSNAFRAWQNQIGAAIAEAVQRSGAKRVVSLSSIGAHLPDGTGPIAGLHDLEQKLNAIAGLDLLHLRPGYFMENHFNALGTILPFGVYADMIDGSVPIGTIATQDIAAVLARELANIRGTGPRFLHLRSPKLTTQDEAAAILGAAIGKPDLKHVRADPAQAKAGMTAHGLSQNMADLFEEMSVAISGSEFNRAFADGPTEITPTTLEAWAPSFAAAYAHAASAAKAA